MKRFKLILAKFPFLYSVLRRVNSFLSLIIICPMFLLDVFWGVYYFRTFRIVICNHITYGIRRLGKKNTLIPHPVGIVIGKNVILGTNCVLYQNITIGVKEFGSEAYPTIGDNVTVYAGALIIGNIKVGDNCVIGAGCVVNKDVPSEMVAYGNPMKIISKKSTN